ncbi:MAG: DNA repair protein RadC [Bacteroidales bacterium]|nr:DNA repair protein RadC [Bacteroidales bacterium]
MKIKDLSPDEQPREKMIRSGASSLSNTELIAILLRTGSGEVNAIDIARALLKMSGGRLTSLSSLTVDQMRSAIFGIGEAKAITVAAAFELGRRFSLESFDGEGPLIKDSRSIYQMMRPHLLGVREEQCWAIGLDSGKGILFKEMVSKGSAVSTTLNERKIVQISLERNAFGVIVVHNHPSGNPHPSPDDIEKTRKLASLLRSVDITLVDHVVVSDGSYFSFMDELISMEEC